MEGLVLAPETIHRQQAHQTAIAGGFTARERGYLDKKVRKWLGQQ